MRKILISNLLRLGDLIFSLPIAENLKIQFNQSEIAYMVRDDIKELFKHVPYVDRVFPYRNKFSIMCSFNELRKFDTVIFVVEKDITRLRMFSLLHIKKRIGFSFSKKTNKYLTDIVFTEDTFQGMEKLFLTLLQPLNIKNIELRTLPRLSPDMAVIENLKSTFSKFTKRLIIHTDTYAPSRKWPYFRILIEKILANIKENTCIILTGKRIDEYFLQSEKIIDLRGKTSLSQLAALFKIADLVVGCDTGAMHLSRAVGTKSLVIYGPEDPKITISSKNLEKIYPQFELPCKKNNDYFGIPFKNIKRCKLQICSSLDCLKNTSPQQVYEIIRKFLN